MGQTGTERLGGKGRLRDDHRFRLAPLQEEGANLFRVSV